MRFCVRPLPAAGDGKIKVASRLPGGRSMISRWRTPFPLLLTGALLYAAVVAICIRAAVADDKLPLLELSVPLFGLPFLLSSRRRRWRLAVYFLLLVPAFHYLAVTAAIQSTNWRNSGFLPGVIGGVTGSVLSFA